MSKAKQLLAELKKLGQPDSKGNELESSLQQATREVQLLSSGIEQEKLRQSQNAQTKVIQDAIVEFERAQTEFDKMVADIQARWALVAEALNESEQIRIFLTEAKALATIEDAPARLSGVVVPDSLVPSFGLEKPEDIDMLGFDYTVRRLVVKSLL